MCMCMSLLCVVERTLLTFHAVSAVGDVDVDVGADVVAFAGLMKPIDTQTQQQQQQRQQQQNFKTEEPKQEASQ